MAVGLKEVSSIDVVAGVRVASVAAGIKANGRDDLVVFALEQGSVCAASFTRNAFCAAPVVVAREHLAACAPRALLINSGNANAGTGETGMNNARQSCAWLAQALGCRAEEVLPFSTGVIGEQLPMDVMQQGIDSAAAQLVEDNWLAAAKGIMTTDTLAKGCSRRLQIDGHEITLSGISKGSGMIRPDMATMLAFIATDAAIEAGFLQQCLDAAVAQSFNAISVDGDTSTNDACVLVATGRAGNARIDAQSPGAADFAAALNDLCRQLAQAIVRDGEGASKFVTVRVEQAASVDEAREVAYTIAHSPLVKTALFASDPNWGRILAAVGRAGIAALDIAGVNLYLDDVCIVRGGGVAEDYTEVAGQAVMDREEILIRVELGRGSEQCEIWTCDLSHEYVRINAEYRS